MQILQYQSQIIKHSVLNENSFAGKVMESDKPTMGLYEHDPVLKSRFLIKNNIYITNVDTDFILDIDIQTGLQFDHDTPKPTVQDLYELYLKAKESEREIILKHPQIGDLWFRVHINVPNYFRPLHAIEKELTKCIDIIYPYH